ncbi:hypothetical protein [Romboutsia sp. 13368]|uniref:hypothetical protein n=1 Tax=Romboutsia sp. 13368 TaxID=2708053 RepID=UPI0025CDFEE8|nr:hypothetical protein [Romboutsia sp. 13368]
MIKSFLTKYGSNILDVLCLIITIIGLYIDNIIYILIGAYIQIAQRISNYIKSYRDTKKLKLHFVIDLATFCIITLIFISKVFSIQIQF